MRILHVVGVRPNFMKIAPIMREMSKQGGEFEQILIHTGQHYDSNMSQVFFDQLDLPRPDMNLEVGSGSHAEQTAQVMLRFEPVLKKHRPDWLVVPGDVNSTLACALVASKFGTRIAHVEAGLRSFNRSMPEEINRILTDRIADLLLTPSLDGDQNLLREGAHPDSIHFVGNVMIDTLARLLPMAEARWQTMPHGLTAGRFILVTLHRPSNVDDPATLREIMLALNDFTHDIPVIFPVHPRTRKRILELVDCPSSVELLDPLSYLDFVALEIHAKLVLTDSGGVQEETTYLGVPCLTARSNTERPVTITSGTNRLVESKRESLIAAVRESLNGSGGFAGSPAGARVLGRPGCGKDSARATPRFDRERRGLSTMKVVILAGGLGTRLREETEFRPKPMVEISGRPILWHIMKIYAHHGFTDFVLCLGYKGDVIRDYFLNYEIRNRDVTVTLGSHELEIHKGHSESGWRITLAETGDKTLTGGRLARIATYLDSEPFMVTYGDGVADVDVKALLSFHQSHGKLGTVTAVRPSSRYGELSIQNGLVQVFREKPQVHEGGERSESPDYRFIRERLLRQDHRPPILPSAI